VDPGFWSRTVIKLDTRLMKYKSYTIPSLSKGESSLLMRACVDSNTQEVWIHVDMSDRMFRFCQEKNVSSPTRCRRAAPISGTDHHSGGNGLRRQQSGTRNGFGRRHG